MLFDFCVPVEGEEEVVAVGTMDVEAAIAREMAMIVVAHLVATEGVSKVCINLITPMVSCNLRLPW